MEPIIYYFRSIVYLFRNKPEKYGIYFQLTNIMKTKFYNGLLCILLCMCVGIIHAQKQTGAYTVKGVLADSILNESEPYATIRISKAVSQIQISILQLP